jgi:hypothetical protein
MFAESPDFTCSWLVQYGCEVSRSGAGDVSSRGIVTRGCGCAMSPGVENPGPGVAAISSCIWLSAKLSLVLYYITRRLFDLLAHSPTQVVYRITRHYAKRALHRPPVVVPPGDHDHLLILRSSLDTISGHNFRTGAEKTRLNRWPRSPQVPPIQRRPWASQGVRTRESSFRRCGKHPQARLSSQDDSPHDIRITCIRWLPEFRLLLASNFPDFLRIFETRQILSYFTPTSGNRYSELS